MKNCATCIHIRRKCDGNCEGCRHAIMHRVDRIGCRCLECHDEDSGKYRYYEENTEITRLLSKNEGADNYE